MVSGGFKENKFRLRKEGQYIFNRNSSESHETLKIAKIYFGLFNQY